MKSLAARQWMQGWIPKEAVAGKKGSDLYDVLTSLDTDAYLISLDFQQAFDNVHPTLAIRIMSQLGLPAGICNMLTNVWSQQQRYMYLDIVRQSLPQGDAFSMMAMIATLTPATVALRGQFPDVVHRTYCDDRTFCGPIAAILQFKDQWCRWSEALGLKENPDKSVHWHSTAKGRKKLQEAGVPAAQIQEHPRLLGCELAPRKGRADTVAEVERFTKAAHLLRKISLLPVSWARKKLLISTKVLGLAAFGWFFRTTTMAKTNKLQTMIPKTLQKSHCASPELRHSLRGHNLHVRFRILHGMLGTIHRRAQKQMLPDKQWHTPWAANLQRLMKEISWQVTGPWIFLHHTKVTLSLAGSNLPKSQIVQHNLREAWRSFLWKKFQNSKRRDKPTCPYNADITAWARRQANETKQHFMVLSGSTVSPAALAKMKKQEVEGCFWCSKATPATLEHVTWICPAFEEERKTFFQNDSNDFPEIQNLAPLQKRLGWASLPLTKSLNGVDPRWMIHVRLKILAARYQN